MKWDTISNLGPFTACPLSPSLIGQTTQQHKDQAGGDEDGEDGDDDQDGDDKHGDDDQDGVDDQDGDDDQDSDDTDEFERGW